jgi:mono/diheme cytochrome c family protein
VKRRACAALTLCCLALAGAGGPGWPAGETAVQLQDGPGRDLTTGRCIICHSLEYIPSNAPAMNRGAWQKSIQKMRERFGAPISDDEAKQILDYLDGSYSGKSS